MKNINFKKVEEKAISLFGEKAVISYAQIRVGSKGYVVKLNIQGLPFEITASAENLESAEEQATGEFIKRMSNARENDLFKTQPDDRYERVKLSDEELDKLYRFEDYLSDDYLKEIKEKTNAWVCQLKENKFECVLESSYKNLHSRGIGTTKQTAIMAAMWKAHDIFDPELIRVGKVLI